MITRCLICASMQCSTVLLAVLCLVLRTAAADKSWNLSPYDVELHVAVDSTLNPGTIDRTRLVENLKRFIDGSLRPFWNTEFLLLDGLQNEKLLKDIDSLEQQDNKLTGFDKQLFLTVETRLDGVRLTCREYDGFTGHWAPPSTRLVRQDAMLPQQCFSLICETFSPLALILIDVNDEQYVELSLKGADLIPEEARSLFIKPHEVYQPFLARSAPSASREATRKLEVAWTYILTEKPEEASLRGFICSGSRRPFGVRRRAGIDIIAIELKAPLPETHVRFHASHDLQLGLSRYPVIEENGRSSIVTYTNDQGIITVKLGSMPITWLTLSSESQLLAKIPIMPGSSSQVEIPISDDVARLLAEEALEVFKERLIDVVARRNILMARARDQHQQGKTETAKKLLDEISNLPSRSNLDRQLVSLESNPAYRSANPRVQGKIDSLFLQSRSLLSTFLSTREILDLEAEIKQTHDASPDVSPPGN